MAKWNWNATVVETKLGQRRIESSAGEVEAPTREAARDAVRRDLEGKGTGRTAIELKVGR